MIFNYDEYDESKVKPEDKLIFNHGKDINLNYYKIKHPFKSKFLTNKKIEDIRMGRIH